MIERGDRVRGAPSYAYTQNQSRITRDTHKTVSIQNVVARVARVPSTHRASDRIIINQSIINVEISIVKLARKNKTHLHDLLCRRRRRAHDVRGERRDAHFRHASFVFFDSRRARRFERVRSIRRRQHDDVFASSFVDCDSSKCVCANKDFGGKMKWITTIDVIRIK
jgi:hypothetical protein